VGVREWESGVVSTFKIRTVRPGDELQCLLRDMLIEWGDDSETESFRLYKFRQGTLRALKDRIPVNSSVELLE
jgi:hypothetical protein